jgi:hypothetical protein
MRVIVPRVEHRDELVRETVKLYWQPFSIKEIRKDLWDQGFDINRFQLVQIIRRIPGIEKAGKQLWRRAA